MRFRLALTTPAAAGGIRSSRAQGSPSTRNPFRKRVLRRNADVILRSGARVHPDSALLTWRAAELTSARERRLTARSLRRIVKELGANTLPSAVPLNRRGVRPYAAAIAALADRIGDPDLTVSARGMLLVHDLLTGGDSPLYARENIDRLPNRLRAIQHALGEAR